VAAGHPLCPLVAVILPGAVEETELRLSTRICPGLVVFRCAPTCRSLMRGLYHTPGSEAGSQPLHATVGKAAGYRFVSPL
jgi:hypothetical protein